MFARRGSKPQVFSFTVLLFTIGWIARLSISPAAWAQVQHQAAEKLPTSPPAQGADASGATALRELVAEAEQNNPEIRAAQQSWEAAKQVAPQVSALPDPQAVLQQFSVGSPRPFAGYTNSDFAYVGLGVSQDLPYPGKLRLKGEIAEQDANAAQQQYEAVRRSVLEGVRAAYLQLASIDETLRLLQSDGQLLQQVEQAADARYRSGMGNQQDVLQAQLEQTKLLSEISTQQLDAARIQAELKQLLNRAQSSADIVPTELMETPFAYSFDELLAAAQSQNPQISGWRDMVQRQKLQVDLAHKDFRPDFNLQYMWQRTDPEQYRAYYMLTFGVSLPVHRGKLHAELAQAQADFSRSQSELQAQSQAVAAEIRIEYDTAQKTSDLIQIDREGLLPQARAAFQSGLAAYQNNREDFQPVLNAFLDVLHLDEEYWQDLSQRETALARLEELTGLPLREEAVQP